MHAEAKQNAAAKEICHCRMTVQCHLCLSRTMLGGRLVEDGKIIDSLSKNVLTSIDL